MSRPFLAVIALALAAGACEPDPAPVELGPVDGFDLPPTDTGRVRVGDPAPDFSLESYRGDIVTLSDFRGRRDVVLAFYRGHW